MSYVYTVARLRGMETRILDTAFFSRLIDSPTLDDALKLLAETSYAQWLNKNNYDKAIDSELLATCQELGQFVPDKDILTLFRLPYDFHNVKVLLKSLFKVRGGDPDGRRHDLLSNLGSFPVQELTEAIETEEYGFLPWGLTDVIPQCWSLWDQTKNPQAVERVIDHSLFKAMLSVAEGLKMPEITKWVKHKIDAENLKGLIRLARIRYDAAKGLPFFYEGGNIRADDVAKLLNEPMESWKRLLSWTDIVKSLQNMGEGENAGANMSDTAKNLDEYIVNVLKYARYSVDAPENVLLYLLTKDAEARNMRVALVCVAGGLQREFARRLLIHV